MNLVQSGNPAEVIQNVVNICFSQPKVPSLLL